MLLASRLGGSWTGHGAAAAIVDFVENQPGALSFIQLPAGPVD